MFDDFYDMILGDDSYDVDEPRHTYLSGEIEHPYSSRVRVSGSLYQDSGGDFHLQTTQDFNLNRIGEDLFSLFFGG